MPEQTWVVGLYVYEDSSATIRTDAEIEFRAFPGDELTAIGRSTQGLANVSLKKGIYRFAPAKKAPLEVVASNAEPVTARGKDPPPDPTVSEKFTSAFGGVTHAQLKDFFRPTGERGA